MDVSLSPLGLETYIYRRGHASSFWVWKYSIYPYIIEYFYSFSRAAYILEYFLFLLDLGRSLLL